MTKSQKGFTLIELLVVIAIIGILAGILFVAINPKAQTDKANISNIKAQLSQVPTQAAINNSSSYDDVCTANTSTKALIDAAGSVTGATAGNCTDAENSFAADVSHDGTSYCVSPAGLSVSGTADTAVGTNGVFDCVSGN